MKVLAKSRFANPVVVALFSAAAGILFFGHVQAGSLMLSGSNEVPSTMTGATGTGSLAVAANHSVSGSISVSGMTATAAHIHMAAAGKNGPVIIPLTKTGNNTFVVPADARLTDAQYAAYMAGDLYVNVHSAAHPGGEVRAQLKP